MLRQKISVEQRMRQEMKELLDDLKRATRERDDAQSQLQRLLSERAQESKDYSNIDKAFASQQLEIQKLHEGKVSAL